MRLRCGPSSGTGRRRSSRRNRRTGVQHGPGPERIVQTFLYDPAAADLFDYSIDDDGSNSESMLEPELYSLVRRGNQCDWAAVSRRLGRIRESIEYLRLANDNRCDVYENDGRLNQRESFSGIVVGRGQPLNRQLILRDLRDLTWRHPYSGVTALHVAVCWHPPQEILRNMVELALDVPEFLFPRAEDRMNPLWARSKHGLTPLHLACSNVAEEHVARTLLETCVPALPMLGRVETSVIRAAAATGWRGRRKCDRSAYALLQTREKGSTPLHCAAQSGASVGVMRLLIEAQPHATLVRDADGLTPLDVLCRGHERFLDRILVLIRVQQDVRLAKRRKNEPLPTGASDDANANITTDLPSELDHAVGPPANDDPNLESYRRSFLREPLRELWSKSTLLIRTMAEVLDDSGDCSIDDRRDDAESDLRNAGEQSKKRYETNASILHAVGVVAPQRGGRIPLALLHLIAAAIPNQARTGLRHVSCSRELPLHAAIRASFSSHSMMAIGSESREAPAGARQGRHTTAQSQVPSDGWRRHPGGVAFVPVQRLGGAESEPMSMPSNCAAPVDVVEALLDLYPESTRVLDEAGRTPLSLALQSYSRCSSFIANSAGYMHGRDEVVRALLMRDPACLEGLGLPDEVIVRAIAKFTRWGMRQIPVGHFVQGDLNTVFGIMRSKPDLVAGRNQSFMPRVRRGKEGVVAWSR